MKNISLKTLNSINLKYNGRSSDYIFPSLVMGCPLQCKYCYCRRHKPFGLDIATNLEEILSSVDQEVLGFSWPKIPNQCDPEKYVLDIGCNTDISVMSKKFLNWEYLFKWFMERPKIKATFATKYVNRDFLSLNTNRSVRIRFSLMPQKISNIMEPGTSSITDRINAVNDFVEAGYEVHLNFSPVIWYNNEEYSKRYVELFTQVNDSIKEEYKKDIFSEVIFLTHSKKLHDYNLSKNFKHEFVLWNPDLQEEKITSYGSEAVRYNKEIKPRIIQEFKELHTKYIPWNKIRYIF